MHLFCLILSHLVEHLINTILRPSAHPYRQFISSNAIIIDMIIIIMYQNMDGT